MSSDNNTDNTDKTDDKPKINEHIVFEHQELTESVFKFDQAVLAASRKYKCLLRYDNMLATKEAMYSTILPVHMEQVVRLFERVLGMRYPEKHSEKIYCAHVLDATANIGGDALTIATYFKNVHVTALEINPATYNVLCTNVKKLNLSNLSTIHTSCYDFINEYDISKGIFDYIYFDPPWSYPGYEYKRHQRCTDLYIKHGDTYISVFDAIKLAFDKGMTDTVILKAPFKFDTGPKLGIRLYGTPIKNEYGAVSFFDIIIKSKMYD
jgi:RNA cap guanine-N2 methyltransferase